MSTKGSYHLLYNTKMKNSKDKSECHNICFKIRYFCRFSLKKKKKKNQKNQKNEIGCFLEHKTCDILAAE